MISRGFSMYFWTTHDLVPKDYILVVSGLYVEAAAKPMSVY
jgi:hypothetical protein